MFEDKLNDPYKLYSLTYHVHKGFQMYIHVHKNFFVFFLMVNWQHFKNWQDNNSHKTDLFEIHTQIMYPILLST